MSKKVEPTMLIKSLAIKNFRCFEEITINLNEKYTILVGSNGAGKSTILDAIAISLGSYISAFDNLKSNTIHKTDAHYKMYAQGSVVNSEPQFPVEITVCAEQEKKEVIWKRALNSSTGRTTVGDAKNIIDIAHKIQKQISDKNIILPLITYYGTGRLWMQKKERRANNIKRKSSRLDGYIDCLDAASNEKLMLKWFEKMTYIQLQEGRLIPELEAVKKAMEICYKSTSDSIKNVKFAYNVKSYELEITLWKTDDTVERLPVSLMSDGIKSTLSMVADIAYRMAVLNPDLLDDVLKTPGIVLIDELDMHLHPNWQKKIIKDLGTIFPELQFICTTHSPSVLVNVPKEHILIFDNYQVYEPQNNTYGRDVQAILREIMGADVRPPEVTSMIESFYEAIDNEELVLARKILEELVAVLGENDSEFIKAKISLDLEECD